MMTLQKLSAAVAAARRGELITERGQGSGMIMQADSISAHAAVGQMLEIVARYNVAPERWSVYTEHGRFEIKATLPGFGQVTVSADNAGRVTVR